MIDFFREALPVMGTMAAWMVTGCLLVLGLIGTLVPFLPGHLILFFAAGAHWLMLKQDSGVVEMKYVALHELGRR